MSFELHKITANIGARVIGIDPSTNLSDETVAGLRDALGEHKALVFEAPGLDALGQERFASLFGPLTAAHPTVPGGETPQVLDVDGDWCCCRSVFSAGSSTRSASSPRGGRWSAS